MGYEPYYTKEAREARERKEQEERIENVILNLPDSVLDSLYAITHFENEPNVQYWQRILKDPTGNAKAVKLADIRDNTSAFRMQGLPEKDQSRMLKKYEQALHVLNGGN